MKKLKSKITLGVLFLFLIIVLLSILGILFTNKLAEETKGTIIHNYTSVEYSFQMLNSIEDMYLLQVDQLKTNSFDDSVLISSIQNEKNIFEIKSDLIEGKIVIVENPDKIWLMKAQVLGVRGVIVIGDKSEVDDLDLPIVGVEETKVKELLAKYKEEDLVRVLINSRLGRVLVVVQ